MVALNSIKLTRLPIISVQHCREPGCSEDPDHQHFMEDEREGSLFLCCSLRLLKPLPSDGPGWDKACHLVLQDADVMGEMGCVRCWANTRP